MKQTAQYLLTAVAIATAIDVMIVLWTMLQISSGTPTPHIPFWDAQISAIVSVMK